MVLKLKESISAEENQKIHELAVKIAFEISRCGPLQVSFSNGKHEETTNLNGFNGTKATKIIEEMVWDFFMREY